MPWPRFYFFGFTWYSNKFKLYFCFQVSAGRYENPAAGAIEVISPPSSPVQPQQDKPEDGQQQVAGMNTGNFFFFWSRDT